MVSKITKLIVTFLGTGYSRICPGTVASIATLPLWFLIALVINYFQIDNPIFVIALIILSIYIIGYIHVKKYVTEKNLDDPKEVVIDEVVGQLLTFSLVANALVDNLHAWTAYVIGFFLFRLFDIWKPQPARWADSKIINAWGVMLDDVFAGIFASIALLAVLCYIVNR